MAKNPLLQRQKMGKAPPTTQDLPGEDFTYGKPSHGDLSVKEIFNHWSELQIPGSTTSRKDFKPKEDFVATNRAAIRHGCKTAHDFRQFHLKHPVYKKTEKESGNAESQSDFVARCQTMTHGKKTSVSNEINDCVTFKTCRDAKEKAVAKKLAQAELGKSVQFSSKVTWSRAARPTKASRGHTYQPYRSPRESETFKMKRFLNIEHGLVHKEWEGK